MASDRRTCGRLEDRPDQPRGSADRDYYTQAADRLGANRACLAIARKLLKRSYHTLSELGEEALQPA
jgi:transposase